MKLNIAQTATAPNGKPYEKSEDDKSPATVGWLCANAVLDCKSTQEASGVVKDGRGMLARKLLSNSLEVAELKGTADLTLDELKIIKDCVGEMYGAWVVHQLWTILEGRE